MVFVEFVAGGYDYVGEQPLLIMFLKVTELETALACVIDVIENVCVVENDLRQSAVLAVVRDGRHEVFYPPGFEGQFLPLWPAHVQ